MSEQELYASRYAEMDSAALREIAALIWGSRGWVPVAGCLFLFCMHFRWRFLEIWGGW